MPRTGAIVSRFGALDDSHGSQPSFEGRSRKADTDHRSRGSKGRG
ncbi:Hypothetical protein A7982_11716 [Minicystis rosea]|nr:Hypothetical protein A7982_11716 [Minicystis rosea]